MNPSDIFISQSGCTQEYDGEWSYLDLTFTCALETHFNLRIKTRLKDYPNICKIEAVMKMGDMA